MTTSATVRPWTAADFAGPDDEVGITFDRFADAVSVWSWMQSRRVSVAETAMTFSTSPEIIRKSVEEEPYLFLCGGDGQDPTQQFIEHDAE